MRTGGKLLVVLTLSVFTALVYPAAAGQPSVPAGPNLCEDVETLSVCKARPPVAGLSTDDCKNRLQVYVIAKFPNECPNYAQPASFASTSTQCKDALRGLSSCGGTGLLCANFQDFARTSFRDNTSTSFSGECRETFCVQCGSITAAAQCRSEGCTWTNGWFWGLFGGTCSGTQCSVGTDYDCCAKPSEASCAEDHLYFAADFGDLRQGAGCSSTSGLYTTCCVKSRFRWGDAGEIWLHCADHGENCKCKGKVRYGEASSGTWSLPRNASGTVFCDHFGFGDPKYGSQYKTSQCSSSEPQKGFQYRTQNQFPAPLVLESAVASAGVPYRTCQHLQLAVLRVLNAPHPHAQPT